MTPELLLDDVVERGMFPLSSLNQVIEVGHIGLMVLSIVVVEGLGGDILSKLVSFVGKFRESEAHVDMFIRIYHIRKIYTPDY